MWRTVLHPTRKPDTSKFYIYLFQITWTYDIMTHIKKSNDYRHIFRADSVRLRVDDKIYSIPFPDTTSIEEIKRMNFDLQRNIIVLKYREDQYIEKELIEKLANAISYIDVEFYGGSDIRKVFSLTRADMAQLKWTCQQLLVEHTRYISGRK